MNGILLGIHVIVEYNLSDSKVICNQIIIMFIDGPVCIGVTANPP